MKTSQTFSMQTIVVLLVFLCAAMMTSLFVYHLRTQIKPAIITSESATIFSDPREIKPFHLINATGNVFTQKHLANHWTLLFFGFTHCASICPSTLALMNRVYNELQPQYPNLQVVLISLDPERDTKDALLKYTQSFNKNFIGASGKIEELHQLQSQFGVYSARDSNNKDYQLQHTASIFLINPEAKWAAMFKYGLTSTQLKEAFLEAVKT